MLLAVGIQVVDQAQVATVVTLGERPVERGPRRELDLLHVSRDADDGGLTGRGVDAREGGTVRAKAGSIRPGVAAQQQDVVAAVLGRCHLGSGENLGHGRAGAPRGDRPVAGGSRGAEKSQNGEPRDEWAGDGERADQSREPKRVKREYDPEDRVGGERHLHDRERDRVGHDGVDHGAGDQVDDQADNGERPEQEGRAHREPAEPSVAREHLHGTGDEQIESDKPPGAPGHGLW